MADRTTCRLALAGAGWAGRVHTLAIAETPGATISAVAASTVGDAEELAAAVGTKPVSPDRLPAGADAVVIATPAATHADLACRMLEAGVGVLIEQPLATTLDDADRIIDAAERSGAPACTAEHLLFSPAMLVAGARARQLGTIRHLEVRCTEATPDWGHFAAPLHDGGALLHLGPHALAIAVLLAGDDPVVAVRSRLGSSRADGVDDVARVEVRFASDLIAAVDVSWLGEAPSWSAQASSDTGVVRVEFQPTVEVEVDGEAVELPQPTAATDRRVHDLGFADQMRGFTSMLARHGGRVCPAGFGRAMLELVCAASASANADGDEVALPFTGDRSLTPMQLWAGTPTG